MTEAGSARVGVPRRPAVLGVLIKQRGHGSGHERNMCEVQNAEHTDFLRPLLPTDPSWHVMNGNLRMWIDFI